MAPLVEPSVIEGPFGGKPVKNWTIQEVVQWVSNVGFQDCAPVFQAHSVTGRALPRMNPELLAEMGIANVGRRLLLMAEITKLQGLDRAQWRTEVIWEGDEYRAGPCNGVLPFGFPLCCECATGYPATYKLSNSKFASTEWIKNMNYPGCGCMGYTVRSNNIDLSDFKDVDLMASTSLVGDPPGTIAITVNNGTVIAITLQSSQCAKVNALLTNAKEEAVIQQGLMQFGRA